MNTINYKKLLLNRVTVTPAIIEYLENCLATDDDVYKHSFHKILLHNWTDNEINLFEVLSTFFVATFVPVNFITQNGITTFYTSSLSFVSKIVKLDFLFPYMRNMCSLDILLNDKTSTELFEIEVSVEDIVAQIVNSRFLSNCELNLSNFCNDPEFNNKKIHFYKITLLAQFKVLMLKIGRDTKYLNLSNNNLSQIPLEILNFFIKGNLLGINLSYNNIPSLVELQRVSSRIEKLSIEGNPLCQNVDPLVYIKQITVKFPRLMELDGIRISNYGIMMPFYKTFVTTPDKKTKMIVEKFVTLYFSHYDSTREKIDMFYEANAQMSISTNFTEAEDLTMPKLAMHSRNILNPVKRQLILSHKRWYKKKSAIVSVLRQLPETLHDPTTFTIDVLRHDKQFLYIIIDGVYKETSVNPGGERFFNFRRTFIFNHYTVSDTSVYNIAKEMFSISFATEELKESSFKNPVRHENQLTLINPDPEERDVICRAFTHYTQLRRSEVEVRLRAHNWDMRMALKAFCADMKMDKIPEDKFISQDDMSDISSSLEDEID
ncbi:nuclear RNA export factor 1-like [Zerene cesonia]|uniref:nuclear RNA export factor 1-like n=1 Tax=Zerene cesonia TaxID=33412 RepID=UPI0018E51D45|nr:nuclear RNA export factor 1-like [Zerene cesonia]